MWIVCPSCQNRFQLEPAVVRGRTFRARCSKCESRFDADVETGEIVGAPTTAPPTAAAAAAVSTPPEPSEPSGATERPRELEEILREIDERYDDLMTRNPFALLGVTVESTNQEVMDSYFRMTERYRASRWAGHLTDDESQRMWQLMLRIDEAFNELGDAERRRRSHQMRSAAVERKVKTDLVTGPRAQLIKEQLEADAAFDDGRYEDAKNAYQRCITLAPERGFFLLRLGQSMLREATFANKQPDWLGIERAFDKALKLEAENLEVLMALGEMWNGRGQPSRAMPYFKRVRDVEPNHAGAIAAIEAYLTGKQPAPQRRTTTERLFKFLRRNDG